MKTREVLSIVANIIEGAAALIIGVALAGRMEIPSFILGILGGILLIYGVKLLSQQIFGLWLRYEVKKLKKKMFQGIKTTNERSEISSEDN